MILAVVIWLVVLAKLVLIAFLMRQAVISYRGLRAAKRRLTAPEAQHAANSAKRSAIQSRGGER